MRFRQAHLDFHTSGEIPGIGAKFDKKQFQNALKLGHVDSITVFSKCHHGWSYHPSEVNDMHPHLDFDLLGAQLEACREINVNAPVYISAGLDEKEVLRHPEWLVVDPEYTENNPFAQAHYHRLCMNTPYLDKLAAEVEEVMQKYHPCGIFLDIVAPRRCVCASCVKSMREKGMDITNPEDWDRHGDLVFKAYCARMEQAVRKYSATATIFHNGGHIPRGRRDYVNFNTHLELESLPTAFWGYDHFPSSAAYARTLGKEYLGMTGKFHTSWGEFGGFKHPNALIYETGLSLACGACLSIGDQLHPSGEMNEATYRLIGQAYELVEKKEPYCKNAKNLADIAVLSAEATLGGGRLGRGNEIDKGVNRILLEGKFLFDFVDDQADFSKYKLLILPDDVRLTDEVKEKLLAFYAAGGKLLATGHAANALPEGFLESVCGASLAGENPYRPDYMIPAFPCVNGEAAYVMYGSSMRISARQGVFAYRQKTYFNRTAEHFCSHQHTPNDCNAPLDPAAVMGERAAYISWNVFEDYATKGSLIVKEMTVYAIRSLLGADCTVETNLPDRGIVTVTRQNDRRVVHLLFTYTTVRGTDVEVIEDAVPLTDVTVSLKADKAPARVCVVPQEEDIPFTFENGRVNFTVPRVLLHQMVAVEN